MSSIGGPVFRTMDGAGSHSGVGLTHKRKNAREARIQDLKRTLLQARQVILKELSPAGSRLAESLADVGSDVLDRSASDLQQTLQFLLRERGRNKLKAIDDALERIEEGTFGVCEDCGDRIPMGRLQVMPFATMCRDCKSLHEKREKLFSNENPPEFPFD